MRRVGLCTRQVRVADAGGEWTVSRRFRNFEMLHRALRDTLAYAGRSPDSATRRPAPCGGCSSLPEQAASAMEYKRS